MITKEMFQEAWDKGLVKLTTPSEFLNDGTQGDETVGCIGDYWFFFGGELADELSPAEYALEVPKETIINEMFETINDFSKHPDSRCEYDYYEAYLLENGIEG